MQLTHKLFIIKYHALVDYTWNLSNKKNSKD